MDMVPEKNLIAGVRLWAREDAMMWDYQLLPALENVHYCLTSSRAKNHLHPGISSMPPYHHASFKPSYSSHRGARPPWPVMLLHVENYTGNLPMSSEVLFISFLFSDSLFNSSWLERWGCDQLPDDVRGSWIQRCGWLIASEYETIHHVSGCRWARHNKFWWRRN